ncbi:TetR/AcrR family transcriptional regulator [soil metagenome]
MPSESPERDRLLALVVDHCLEHGVADLTLRRVATATGSNNRMLLYYFGTKEQMIEAALLAAIDRFPRIAGALDPLGRTHEPFDRRLRRSWRQIAHTENLPFLRLFFEVFGLANQQPGRFGAYLDRVGHEWADQVATALRDHGVPRRHAGILGREVLALWRGLQFDLLSTGERRAVDRAHDAAITSMGERIQKLREPRNSEEQG